MLGYAKGAHTTGIEEVLEIVNAKIQMLEEEGIEGYIDELAALTAARNAAREEADRFATERAEQIMAIAEEVRNEKAAPKAAPANVPAAQPKPAISPQKSQSDLMSIIDIPPFLQK